MCLFTRYSLCFQKENCEREEGRRRKKGKTFKPHTYSNIYISIHRLFKQILIPLDLRLPAFLSLSLIFSAYAVVDGIKDSSFLRVCFSSDVIYIHQPIDFRSTQNDAAKISLLSIPLTHFLLSFISLFLAYITTGLEDDDCSNWQERC